MKVLYLVATTRRKNRTNLTGKTNGWKAILNTLTVHYGDRIADHIRRKPPPPDTQKIGQSRIGSQLCGSCAWRTLESPQVAALPVAF